MSDVAVRHMGAAQRLREKLLALIDEGNLREGDRIRPLRELSADFRLSYVATHRVIRELIREGYVDARRGRAGTYATGKRRVSVPVNLRHILFVFDEEQHYGPGHELYGYYQEMLKGANTMCRNMKAHLVYKPIPRRFDSHIADELTELGRSGGVMLVGDQLDRGLAMLLRDRSLRVVLVDRWIDESFNTVSVDYAGGIREAVTALVTQGHRRFGFVSDPLVSPSSHAQVEHLKAAVRQAFGEPGNVHTMYYAHVNQFAPLVTAMLEGPQRPTAIFGGTDCDAYAMVDELKRRQIAVPGAISVVGFGNTDLSRRQTPNLSTIDVDKALMGREAVALLLEPGAAAVQRAVPSHYRAAGSTGPAKA